MNMKALFIALLVSLVLPLAANAQNENFQDRSARTVSPGPDAAQVSGIMGKPNRELFRCPLCRHQRAQYSAAPEHVAGARKLHSDSGH